MQEQLLRVNAAAKILNVSPSTVRYLDLTGELRAIRADGGMRLFHRGEVERLARKREAKAAVAASGIT